MALTLWIAICYFGYLHYLRNSMLALRTANRADARSRCPLGCTGDEELKGFTRLAVIRPYVEYQIEKLTSNMQRWDHADAFPCEVPVLPGPRPVLFLYFNRRSDANARVRGVVAEFKLAIESLSSVRKCFDSVEFIDADLSDEQDRYCVITCTL